MLFVIAALIFYGVYMSVPAVKAGTDNFVGNTVGPAWTNLSGGVTNAVAASPIWHAYGGWITLAAGACVGVLGLLVAQNWYNTVKLALFKRKQPKPYMGEPEYVPPSVLPQQSTSTTVKVAETAKAIETSSTPKEETTEQVEVKE